MANINLEFLYYITPLEYMGLDTDDDPRTWELIDQSRAFEKYMAECSLSRYIFHLVILFRDKFPNGVELDLSLREFDRSVGDSIPEKTFRQEKDIRSLNFHYIDVDPSDEYSDEILVSMEIIFTNRQPNNLNWIEEGLKGKPYTKSLEGNLAIYQVEDSPILKIEANDLHLKLFINKEKIIEY